MATVNIPDVEIFRTGTHNGDTYTVADLRQMISAGDQVGFTPPVKLGHMDDKATGRLLKKEGMPAFGYVKNLRVAGQKLLADFVEVPKRLGKLIKDGAYKRVSAEIYWNYKRGSSTFPRVLKAVALLGSELPAITDLADVEALHLSNLDLYKIEFVAHDENENEFRTYLDDRFGVYRGIQLAKDDPAVQYRIAEGTAEQCRTCRFFLGPREMGIVGLCNLVEGDISADWVCSLFRPSDAFISTDGVPGVAETIAKTSEKLYRVEKRGDQYCLIADNGDTLGCHDTEEEALAQERAIKSREAGKKVQRREGTVTEKQKSAELEIPEDVAILLDALDDGSLELFADCPDCDEILAVYEKHGNMAALEAWFKKVGFAKCVQTLQRKDKKLKSNRLCTFLKNRISRQGVKTQSLSADGANGDDTMDQVKELEVAVEERDKQIAELKMQVDKNTGERSEVMSKLDSLSKALDIAREELGLMQGERKEEKIKAFISEMKAQGRIVPKEEERIKALLASADDERTVSFTENNVTFKLSQREAMEKNIRESPSQVDFKEVTKGKTGDGVQFITGNAQDQIVQLVEKYQMDHPEVQYEDAVRRVLNANPELKKQYAENV